MIVVTLPSNVLACIIVIVVLPGNVISGIVIVVLPGNVISGIVGVVVIEAVTVIARFVAKVTI
jgi:hypothetical protein